MSRFLITKMAPKHLQEHEFVIGDPDFYEQIRQCKAKKPRSAQMTAHYLREVLAAVGQKYMGEEFDTLRAINISKFIGVPCGSDKEVHDVLVKAFENQCPKLLLAYVHHLFKQRPAGTNLIYYTGNPKYVTKLVESGWEQISDKEFEDSRSGKPKKVVGKPAITAADAALLNNNGV
jgi:hypothetical protein